MNARQHKVLCSVELGQHTLLDSAILVISIKQGRGKSRGINRWAWVVADGIKCFSGSVEGRTGWTRKPAPLGY